MATKAQIANFVAQITPVAQQIGAQYNIDPRVIIAQAGLETGYGQSAPGNNYFGIKGNGQVQTTQEQGPDGLYTTKQGFRAYPSLEASVADWANLVSKNYPGVVGAAPADAFAALKAGGYATDNNYVSKLNAALTTTQDAGTGPIPPMNIPEVGSAYANTSLPPAPMRDPRNTALDAIHGLINPASAGANAGDALGMSGLSLPSSPVLGDDGQLYRQSGSVPPMDAGYNPANGQTQPYATNNPNILAAMGSGSTQAVPQSPGFASQSRPYYPSSIPSGPGIGQQSQPYNPSTSASGAAGASGVGSGTSLPLPTSPVYSSVNDVANFSPTGSVSLADILAKQTGVNVNQTHDLNAQPVTPLPPPAGYGAAVPQAPAPQTVSTPNGNTYTVGQIFTTPDGTYKVGVGANGQATFTKAPTLPTGGMVGDAIGNAVTNVAGPIISAAPGALSNAASGLGSFVSGFFGGGSTPKGTGVAIPQTAGPAGQPYSTIAGTGVSTPYGGGYNEIDAQAGSSNSAVPQTYGPAGQSYSSANVVGSTDNSWTKLLQSLTTPAQSISNSDPISLSTQNAVPAPTTIQQLNPAYTQWLHDQSKPAMYGVEGVDTPSLDANGNVVMPSSYLGAKAPAPSKYIYVKRPGVAPTTTPQQAVAPTPVPATQPGMLGFGTTSSPARIQSLYSALSQQQRSAQNPAALTALANGQNNYTVGAMTMPTLAANGQVRNTYADTANGVTTNGAIGTSLRSPSIGEQNGW